MKTSKLSVTFSTIETLSAREQASLVTLYLRYYDGSSRARFLNDLKSKNEIMMMLDDGKIIGFTTYELYDSVYRGEPVKVLYSGDTVVDHRYWGQQKFGFEWARRIGRYCREFEGRPFYWFLIVKGHRTYRYLPAFVYNFYPHWTRKENALRDVLIHLASEKFGTHYDQELGIIRYDHSHGHLKDAYAYPTEREMRHEAVAYFLKKNPGYLHGDELACLCRIEASNFKPLTKRLILG